MGIKEYSESVFPLVAGHDVIAPGTWHIYEEAAEFYFGWVLSAWECESVESAWYENIEIPVTDFQFSTTESLASLSGTERLPVISRVMVKAEAIRAFGDMRQGSFPYFVTRGIKHWSYNSGGEKQTYAHRHKEASGSHDSVTNPVWFTAFLLMNEMGLPHSKIDWASAKTWADWCETADGTGSGDHGFDVHRVFTKPNTAEKEIDLILGSAGIKKVWSNGAFGFARVVPTTDGAFVDTGKVYNNSTIVSGSFKKTEIDEMEVPTKFVVEYLDAGTSDGGSPWAGKQRAVLEFTDPKKKFQKNQEETLDFSGVYHPDGFGKKTATGTVAITSGSTSLVGSGTAFSSELTEGETVEIDGNFYEIDTISSNTVATLAENASTTGSGLALYTGGTLLAREALAQARYQMLNRTRYRFESSDGEAILHEDLDYFKAYYNDNGVDFGTVGSPLELRVKKVQIKPSGNAVLKAFPHVDSYFNPHINAVVRASQQIHVHSATNFPTFRFKASAGWSTSTADIPLKAVSGDLDSRALVAGMQVWRYTTGGTPSTEVHYATPTSWEWIGEIDSVSVAGSVATVTLSANANDTAALNDYVMICPYCTTGNAGKFGMSGQWQTNWHLNIPKWILFGAPLVEWLTDDYGATEAWQSFPGGAQFKDDGTDRYFYGGGMVPIPFNDSGYKVNGRSGYGGSVVFPLSMRLTKLNTFGRTDSDEPYIYCFPQSIVIYRTLATTITMQAQSGITGSDWTETFGITILTDYDPDDHYTVKQVEIRYRTYANGAVTNGNWKDGSDTLLYLGPPFRAKTIPDSTGIDIKSINNANPQIYLGLKCINETGEYMENAGTDVMSNISLSRVARMWNRYTGVINEYNSGGDDYRGAGGVWCTNAWTDYAPNWDPTADKWSGGLYIYAPHRPAAAADPDTWTRYGASGGTYQRNGPTIAFENSGDAKLMYHNWGGPSTDYRYEAGCLFYSHYDDPVARGEVLLGLGKGDDRTFSHTYTGSALQYSSLTEQARITTSREKAAAIWIRDTKTAGTVGSSVHSFINGPYLHGPIIGGIDVSTNWMDPDFDFTLENRHTRKFAVLDGDQFSVSTIGNQPYLVSFNFDMPTVHLMHTYAFVDSKWGFLNLFNPWYNGSQRQGVNRTDKHYLVALCHAYQASGTSAGMKINWSPETSYNLAPMQTSTTGPTPTTDDTSHAPWFICSDPGSTYRIYVRVRTGTSPDVYAWKYVDLT